MTDIYYAYIANTGAYTMPPVPTMHPVIVLTLYAVAMLIVTGAALWYAAIGNRVQPVPMARPAITVPVVTDARPDVVSDAVYCAVTNRWRDPKTKRFIKRQDRLPRH